MATCGNRSDQGESKLGALRASRQVPTLVADISEIGEGVLATHRLHPEPHTRARENGSNTTCTASKTEQGRTEDKVPAGTTESTTGSLVKVLSKLDVSSVALTLGLYGTSISFLSILLQLRSLKKG